MSLVDASNPYKPPASDDHPEPARSGPHPMAWLLLPMPFVLCLLILYGSTLIGRIGLVHFLLIGPLPLAVAISAAAAISEYLIRAPWHRIMIAASSIGVFLLWAYISTTFRLNPFP
jgi:hypothetical protein